MAAWPARRHNDPRKIGRRRVHQLDLGPDDRPQPRLLSRGGKADHAVEAVVVRDGQAGESQLDGALDKLVRRRGAIEEREVGVAMELSVGGHRRLGRLGRSQKVNNRTDVLVRQGGSAQNPPPPISAPRI